MDPAFPAAATPQLARLVEEAGRRPGRARPSCTALAALEKRVALGWGVFNVLVVVAVYLMVFKPGS